MTTEAPAKPDTDTLPEDRMQHIEHCLSVFALVSRSRKRTEEILKAEGIETPASTVRSWADKQHPELFERIDKELAERRTELRRAGYSNVADRTMEAQEKGVEELIFRLESDKLRGEMKTKELVELVQKLGIASATATDKERLLGGEPTAIVKRDFEGTLRFLHEMGVGPGEFDFDGTAEEERPPGLPRPTG